jgi:hypothetical protein
MSFKIDFFNDRVNFKQYTLPTNMLTCITLKIDGYTGVNYNVVGSSHQEVIKVVSEALNCELTLVDQTTDDNYDDIWSKFSCARGKVVVFTYDDRSVSLDALRKNVSLYNERQKE